MKPVMVKFRAIDQTNGSGREGTSNFNISCFQYNCSKKNQFILLNRSNSVKKRYLFANFKKYNFVSYQLGLFQKIRDRDYVKY